MLYRHARDPELSSSLFRKPTADYRGAPFWAWNGKLDRSLLLREIEQLKAMGMGGFFIHSRSGLEVKYLGDEFLDLVAACDEKAKQEQMLCWLYDEDRWPSGFGGGYVTQDPRYRARFLLFQPRKAGATLQSGNDSTAQANGGGGRTWLASYAVRLQNGKLAGFQRVSEEEEPACNEDETVWDAFLEVSGTSPWFNNQTYVNTLDPAAIRRFLEVTHETYFKRFGGEFGKSIPAIFTDEPQFTRKQNLRSAEDRGPAVLPFTDDFDETYRAAYGDSILDHLPELFWELPDGRVSAARYRYHDHVSERFASAYADTIGQWCGQHGILLTGHMMEEDTLFSQTRALGDCMRSYRSFQLPGIDVLCDLRQFLTAKQAASAAHQYGRPGVVSELYGVTNWDFDFRRRKLGGDWQAALGVTTRVHHLSWVTMAGEAKRDYPAPIGYQSPWYRQHAALEDHFARLNTALTRGRPRIRLGVIHPVESYWLHWGPEDQTGRIRGEMDRRFTSLLDDLLYNFIDFDLIAESLLPSQAAEKQGAAFRVGQMEYDAVLVPGCETLRATTFARLESFRRAGGRVIFVGKPAAYLDAQPTDRVRQFASTCEQIEYVQTAVLDALEPLREVDVQDAASGCRMSGLLHQMRQDGENRWLFVCHADQRTNPDLPRQENILLRLKGRWAPTVYDTRTGDIRPCSYSIRDGGTAIPWTFFAQDSLLLLLHPWKEDQPGRLELDSNRPAWQGLPAKELPQPAGYRLSEPNVAVLDRAEFSLDDGDWQPAEELLRIGNRVRARLGYPPQNGGYAQPWTVKDEEKPSHWLRVRFSIESDLPVSGAKLALENPEQTEIQLNGRAVPSQTDGFFTDESIRCVRLPELSAGVNTLTLRCPFTKKSNTEWCFLLGSFGVRTAGRSFRLTAAPRALTFGDNTVQGLPFYGGNVTYVCRFSCKRAGRAFVQATRFRAPLLTVSLDGGTPAPLALDPYLVDLGTLSEGPHTLELTAYGSRINTFGALHNCNEALGWVGPDAWRSDGAEWSYEYCLKPQGILKTPLLLTDAEITAGEREN